MAPPLWNLFENADHNPHYTDIESKDISITKCYCIFPIPGKKESSKRKQAKIEVKIIISDTDKQLLNDFIRSSLLRI